MIDKSSLSLKAALSQIKDGSTIMIGGFGTAGQPAELIDGLIELGIKDLVIVNNNAGKSIIRYFFEFMDIAEMFLSVFILIFFRAIRADAFDNYFNRPLNFAA